MKNSRFGYYLKLTLTLLIISAVVSGLLGLTNFVTADRIAEIKAEKTAASMQEVLPAESYISVDYTGAEALVSAVYQAGDAGYVVEVTPSGFGGAINMVVGVDTEGKVSGVAIVSMSETSGLGSNAAKADFRSQYVGQSGGLAVNKDGGTIDALTGATITSRAVTDGVNAALRAVGELG